MIKTEKATQAADLPHDFQGDKWGCALCGRIELASLHRPAAREVAHVRQEVPRELGS